MKWILCVVNEVIKNNLNCKLKNLWMENDEGIKIFYYCGDNEFGEGQFVVGKIYQFYSLGMWKFLDIVILYWINVQFCVIEEMFFKVGLNYNIVGGIKFYDRKEIKDIFVYLCFVFNLDDDISFMCIVNVLKCGVGVILFEKIVLYVVMNGLLFF